MDKQNVEKMETQNETDGRNDEDQLGMSYQDLEEAMINPDSKNFEKYKKIRENNLHKMKEIPVCKFN